VIGTLEQDKAKNNRARAESEAHRTIVIHDRMAEHTIQRVGRSIMRKLDKVGDWVTRRSCAARWSRKIAVTSRTQSKHSRPLGR
jgi:hypothetical protein